MAKKEKSTKDDLRRLKAQTQSIDVRIEDLEQRMRSSTVDEYMELLRQQNALLIKRQAVSDHLSRLTKDNFSKRYGADPTQIFTYQQTLSTHTE